MFIEFEKEIYLTSRQSFHDDTIVFRGKQITIDFGYPFIVDGNYCTGTTTSPCKILQTFPSIKGEFTTAELAKLVKKGYKHVFATLKNQAFHQPEDLVITGLEKNGHTHIWQIIVSS